MASSQRTIWLTFFLCDLASSSVSVSSLTPSPPPSLPTDKVGLVQVLAGEGDRLFAQVGDLQEARDRCQIPAEGEGHICAPA